MTRLAAMSFSAGVLVMTGVVTAGCAAAERNGEFVTEDMEEVLAPDLTVTTSHVVDTQRDFLPADANNDADSAGNVDLPRFPSISPDGSMIVFSWRGDLWKVPAEGGDAIRITNHPAGESYSAWSPDGSRIAFGSSRHGATNLFMMNADGSDVRQVTYTDRSCSVNGFGVDEEGHEVLLLSAYREGDVYREPRIYQVQTTGGDITRVHDAHGRTAHMHADGQRVAFTRGGAGWDRRHYRGASSRDIWLFDRRDDSFTRLTEWAGNDGKSRWGSDENTLYFVSDRELDVVNLYAMDVTQGDDSARRLTSFDEDDVQHFDVSADGTTAVLVAWDTMYTLDLTIPQTEPKPLVIHAVEDDRDNFELKSINREVSEAALSPDGKVMAYVAYGEVFVRNLEDKSPTRRVTHSHAREGEIAWSPDGLKLYFVSDRDGSDSIYAARVRQTRGEIKEEFDKATRPEESEDADQAEVAGEEEDDTAGGDAETEGGDADETGETDAVDDGVSGTWTGTATAPEHGAMPFTLTISVEEDGSASGSIASAAYSGALSGSYDRDSKTLTLTFVAAEGVHVEVILEIADENATGTATAPDIAFEITATRTAIGAAADDEEDADAEEDGEQAEKEAELPKELQPDRWHDALYFDIEPVIADPDSNDGGPNPSPDGRWLLYRHGRGDLMMRDLETGDSNLVVEGWDWGISARWSPNSEYIAYQQSDLDFNDDIWIVPSDLSEPAVNVTQHPDSDSQPRWSADGKILSFVSERTNEEYDVWMVYLDRDLEALTPKELQEYYDEASKAAKKQKPLKVEPPKEEEEGETEDVDAENDENAEGEEADDEDEGEEAEEREALDLEDAYLHIRRVTSLNGSEGNLEMTPAGDYYVFTVGNDDPGLYSVKWDGSGLKKIGGWSNVQHMSLTGDKIVYLTGGQAATMSPTGGGSETHSIAHQIRIDLQAQSSQKFLEMSRLLGNLFYHPTLKGLDWNALTMKYHELALHARTADEFDDVANRFLGELNGSHLGVYSRGESYVENSLSYGRLGTVHHRVTTTIPVPEATEATDDEAEANENGNAAPAVKSEPREVDGFEVTEIIPEGPADKGPMALHVGDVIISVNGEEFGPTDNVESMLQGQIGEECVIGIVRTREDGTRFATHILITPISFGRESDLTYDAWRDHAAELVEEWSDGRLGYIHVEGMNQPSLDVFERDLYAAANGKEGLIVDVRNNGGGWTTDRLLASIMAPPHAYTIPRGADPNQTGHYPQDRLYIQRYTQPMNALCNEKSFSNAEIFAHAFKTLERGTLVGEETYGAVISTGGTSLIDGTFVRLPFRGWYLLDGTDMENNGARPHVLVPQTPQAEAAGEDEQLKAAVEDLLDRLP